MAIKTMTFGDASNTININANGNVVGANLKNKGNSSTPIYFDSNGMAQEVTGLKIITDTALSKTSENAVQNKVITNAIDNLIEVKSGTEVDVPDMTDIGNLQTQITELKNRLDNLIDVDSISF